MPAALSEKIDLSFLRACKAAHRKFAMLTAYDHPTAQLAQNAGVHVLLIGDSLGNVLLGHPTTRTVPFELMLVLSEAVRRGAPRAYVMGDMPFEQMQRGDDAVILAARRFRDDAGCDGVKFEATTANVRLVEQLANAEIQTTVHLGLRPQSIDRPEDYRVQARDDATIERLAEDAQTLVNAGAALVLLEAVPPEASAAVASAVGVPVIGCGAGPACDGHVVVTQDMIGLSAVPPPRFVPRHAAVGETISAAMSRWVAEIESGAYPAPEHTYRMRDNT